MIKFPPGLNYSRWNKKTPYFSQSSCFERQPFLTVLYDPKLKSVQLSILEANQLCLKKLLKRIFFKMFVKIANLISLSQNLLQILHNVISILTSIYFQKNFSYKIAKWNYSIRKHWFGKEFQFLGDVWTRRHVIAGWLRNVCLKFKRLCNLSNLFMTKILGRFSRLNEVDCLVVKLIGLSWKILHEHMVLTGHALAV